MLKVLAVIALSSNIDIAQADQTKPELNARYLMFSGHRQILLTFQWHKMKS